jgi:predicted aspartyl protease
LKKILLVDLDGTIADLDAALIDRGFDSKLIREREVLEFRDALETQTRRAMESEGFFASIPVISGNAKAVARSHHFR